MSELIKDVILALAEQDPIPKKKFERLKLDTAKKYKEANVPENSQFLRAAFEMRDNGEVDIKDEQLACITKADVRSLSGIASVGVFLPPAPCPGQCVYCPTDVKAPKSYVSTAPAVQRAILNGYNPRLQVATRIKAYKNNGHKAQKVEMIVMGGTISSLPREQVTEFIKGLYDGLNGFVSDSLDSSMKANEVAEHRCIGLTLETRPDYVSKEECVFFRSLGCTRIEMGVQSIYNDVLDLTNRGHHIERVMKACKTFKDYGFKVNFHIMPGLPGSTPEKDIEMMDVLFKEPNLCPDMIKIYPCVVFKNAELYDWYKSGKFVPYTNKEIVETIAKMKEKIPKQVRLMRLGRVLPGGVAESYDRVDIRQEVESYMKERGMKCLCIRCREIGNKPYNPDKVELKVTDLPAPDAVIEKYIEFSTEDNDILGMLRLRIGDDGKCMVRELHVYGPALGLGAKGNIGTKGQHGGYGRRLVEKAEEIAISQGSNHLSVISGIGVKGYYAKLGYEWDGLYMTKQF